MSESPVKPHIKVSAIRNKITITDQNIGQMKTSNVSKFQSGRHFRFEITRAFVYVSQNPIGCAEYGR